MKRNKRMSDTKQIIRDTGHREESSIGVIGIPEREVRENEEEAIVEKILVDIFFLMNGTTSHRFKTLYECQARLKRKRLGEHIWAR